MVFEARMTTEDRCCSCGITASELTANRKWGALIYNELRGKKRTVAWVICWPCQVREERG